MLPWCSLPPIWASRCSRSMSAAVVPAFSTRFTATCRPTLGSSVLNTVHDAPRPSSPITTYLPIFATSGGERGLRHERQQDGEAGADARLGIDLNMAAVRRDDAIAHREPEPGALARFLGGEEGIED